MIVPLHEDEKGRLAYMLPYRLSSAFVNVYKQVSPIELDKRIHEQFEKLSYRNLGKDLTLYPEFYGSTIVACYNSVYRSLVFTEDSNNPGIKIAQVAELRGKSKSTVWKQLNELTKKGIIKYRGSDKTGGYYVK